MADPVAFANALSGPVDFKFDEVDSKLIKTTAFASTLQLPPLQLRPTVAPLGALAAFHGNWQGKGFNTIFRPDNTATPTPFKPPIASDNVLELNLTTETLSFSTSLGNVPNRGSGGQGDIVLNGVPYLQTITDVTTLPGNGIHFEPGLWMAIPSTTNPNEPATLSRMASIPHGTTINAQGTQVATVQGPPQIAPVGITPFVGGQPHNKIPFPSQTASNQGTPRLPQDLTSFITAGTITQAMLDDPNTVLRQQIAHQTITQTQVIVISTTPGTPLPDGPIPGNPPPALTPAFGGGTANIAFLNGVPNPPQSGSGPNAQGLQMDAVFWIETVDYKVDVPPLAFGSPPVTVHPQPTVPPIPLQPTFVISPPTKPGEKLRAGVITVPTTQIQY